MQTNLLAAACTYLQTSGKCVNKAVKLLAMPLFYRHHKDITTQHIVY